MLFCRKMCFRDGLGTVPGLALGVFLGISLVLGGRVSRAASNPEVPESLTLVESVLYGLDNNPNIKAAEFEIKKSASDVGQARSQFLPRLTSSWENRRLESISAEGPTAEEAISQDFSSLAIQVVQPLFAGLSNLNGYQQAKMQKELSRQEKGRRELQLILDIQTNFLKLLKAREDVETLEKTVRRLEVNVESAQAYQRQELVPYYQVLQAEVELADAQQELSQARNSVAKLGFTLNSLLNIPVGSDTRYKGRLADFERDFPYSYEQALGRALNKRPEMQSARLQVDMALEQMDVERGKFFPRLDLVGGYTITDRDFSETGTNIFGEPVERDQFNEYWSVGIRLKWDLFSGGSKIHQYQKVGHELRRMQSKVQDIENQIDNQVRSSHISFQEAKERVLSTRKAVQAAREGFARAEKNLQLGLGTIPELLDAQARLRRAEGNWNKARGDQLLAKARLYYSMGIPNKGLDSEVMKK
ncbi:MAG: TolC family protein [Desulfohalobiaceae bacterium]|nr:TolC family protein [Desulfohalobiaceae bacterium]